MFSTPTSDHWFFSIEIIIITNLFIPLYTIFTNYLTNKTINMKYIVIIASKLNKII